MRFKPLVVTASVLLVAALAAIAIAVHLLVPRLLVPALAASVKAGTGRELGVGEVGVTLWPRPALVLSQVRFGNAPWGSLPWLAQASRASAEFDVLGLLSGRLRIRQVTVTDASVLVETDADGVGNWVMGSSGAGKATWPDALEIDALALKALALTYRDGKTGKAMAVQIDSARVAVASPSHSIDLSARGTFDGKPVEAAGTTGPLAALIANAPFPVDLEGKIGAASIGVRGSVEKPRELGGLSLALRAQAAEFADVAALFGATVPPLGPVHGAAQLNGSVAAPAFTGIDLVVGAPARLGLTVRGDLNGAAAAAGGYEWQSGGIDLLVEGAQFSDLARWLGMSLPALGPYRIAARVTGSTAAPALPVIDIALGGRGMPQITLRGSVADLRTASGIDMKVAASATHWWRLETATQGPRLPPFQASARVRGTRQGYRVDDLELKIADSAVNASLQVVQRGPRLRVVGKVISPLIDLARLPPAPGATAATAAAAVSGASRPADHWKLADVDLELQIGRLVLPDGRELQSGSGRLALDNGRLNASALQARLGGGTARLDGSVADPANLAGIELGVALQGGELAELFKFFGTSMAPMGPYQGQARLSGSLDALRLTAIDAAAGRPGQRLRASGQIDDALHWQGIALAITAQVNDSKAAGRLFGADLPRLPALQATARLSGPQGGYVFDDLKLALGRTSVQGRVAFAPGEPRPRVTASLSGSLVDLSELMPPRPGPGATSPTLAVDVEADLRLDRVVLPDRRALGPVSGVARLTAGAVELKQFSVAVDGASAIVDGTIGKPLVPAEVDLVLSAEVKRGAGLATFTGLNLRALPPFTASARLTDVPGGYALTGLKAAHAVTTMAGDVAVTRGAERFKVSATLRSPTLDASALAQPDAAGGTAKPVAEGARAIADVPLPLDILRVIDADIDLRVDAVKFGDAAPLGPLLVRAAVADGRLKVEPMQLAGPANQMLSVSATVDAAQADWDLRIDGKGIDAGAMLARFGHPGVVTGGSTDLALRLRGRGRTLAAILGSLDGDARVAVGPLRLHNLAVNFDRGIFTRALGLANPSHKTDPDTDFECLAAHVPISKGILTSDRSVAAETAKYNVVLSGTVNLRTEGIDAAVTPVVKSGLGVGTAAIASIVRVGGTLGAPVVGVDPVGVAKSAVAAGAAVVATPWWLADAALKKLRSDPSPCTTALAK